MYLEIKVPKQSKKSRRPQLRQPYMVVFAGDHGVVQQGVSVFPQSVTIAMLANFVQGGAAVSVLCQQHGIRLRVVNCGTATPCPDFPSVVQMSVMAGTMDFSVQAAMTEAQALQALAQTPSNCRAPPRVPNTTPDRRRAAVAP